MLAYSIKAGRKKLINRENTFEILGCDIMIDYNLNPFLIEMNSTPAFICDT